MARTALPGRLSWQFGRVVELVEELDARGRGQHLVLTVERLDDGYICGPSGFVEAASQTLVQRGHDPSRIRTERFGPSGR